MTPSKQSLLGQVPLRGDSLSPEYATQAGKGRKEDEFYSPESTRGFTYPRPQKEGTKKGPEYKGCCCQPVTPVLGLHFSPTALSPDSVQYTAVDAKEGVNKTCI